MKTLIGNKFYRCYGIGLEAGGADGNTVIAENTFAIRAGLNISGGSNISVFGNTFRQAEVILGGSDSCFVGNCVSNTEEEGFGVKVSGSKWTVTGNVLSHYGDEDYGTPLVITGHDNMVCGNSMYPMSIENTGADNVIIQGESLVNGGTVGGTLRTKDVFVGGFDSSGNPTGAKSSLRVNGTMEAFGETKLHESVSAEKDVKVGASLTVDGTARTNGNLETHNIKPKATGTYSLGNESKWFKRAYIQTALVQDIKTEKVGEDGSVEVVSLLERIAALEQKVAELEGLDSLDAFVDELIDGTGGEPDADS